MITTRQIYDNMEDIHDVWQFTNECYSKGYMNNASLNAMKWDWCLEHNGAWFATYENNRIISLSGIHPFEDGYRALFRGAQLQPRSCGLNKYHMQSYCFAEQLPLQIKFAKVYPIYITTNVDHDASGRMNKVDRVFHALAYHKLVKFVDCKEVFFTKQNIWRLDTDVYRSKRYSN